MGSYRRWAAKGIINEYFVEWSGRPVKSVKTAFKTALRLAKVSGRISPHTLRHTAATWLMQNGVDKWEAAGFLGMLVEMLDRVYGHHHPDHLRGAAHALGYRRPQSLAITLAPGRRPRQPDRQPVGKAGGPGRTRTSNQTVMSGGKPRDLGENSVFSMIFIHGRECSRRLFLGRNWCGKAPCAALQLN